MPAILTTQEAEVRRIMIQSQLRQKVWENLSQKHPTQNRAGRVDQVVECLHKEALGPEFKPQYCQLVNK
jgi:hypothetical protein